MPIKDIPYDKLETLIRDNLSTDETENTIALIRQLRSAKQRGWLTKDDLIAVCQWKSPRAIRHIKSNRVDTIKKITQTALKTRSEQTKIAELTKLKGVSLPMASSILMLTNPKRYGVIDIRVWELMFQMGTMRQNPKGVNFNFKQWYRYLVILRHFAEKFKVKARDIERTLFFVHKDFQDGQLYRNLTNNKKKK